jgi:hypothetical protein
LVEDGLEGPGINFKENIAGFDVGAFHIVLLEEVATDLGANLGVHVAIEGADPFLEDGDVGGGGGDDLDFGRRGRGGFLFAAAKNGDENARRQDGQREG